MHVAPDSRKINGANLRVVAGADAKGDDDGRAQVLWRRYAEARERAWRYPTPENEAAAADTFHAFSAAFNGAAEPGPILRRHWPGIDVADDVDTFVSSSIAAFPDEAA